MTNFITGAWAIIWEVLGWFQICTFVPPWMEGILIRRGKYVRNVGGKVDHFLGVAWHLPWEIDTIYMMNVKPAAMSLQEQSLTTLDDKHVVCSGVLMWSIFDIRKAFIDVEDAEETLGQIAVGIVHELVEQNDWNYIQGNDFRNEIKRAMNKQSRVWGLTVNKFKFQDLTESKSYRIFGGLS